MGFSEWDDISQVQYDTGAAAVVQEPSDSLNSVTFSNVTEQVVPVDVINDLLHTAIGGNSALEKMVRKLKIEATQKEAETHELKIKVEQLTNKNEQLTDKYDKVNESLDRMNDLVNNESMSASRIANEDKAAELATQLAQQTAHDTALEANIAALVASIAALEVDKTALAALNAALKADKTQLEAKLKAIRSLID